MVASDQAEEWANVLWGSGVAETQPAVANSACLPCLLDHTLSCLHIETNYGTMVRL